MSTTFVPDLDLSLVDAHPKNPRRNAIADDELVASIKVAGLVQPLVVTPQVDNPGRFWLIAGHRREDGCTKAGRITAPALVRTDLVTEGQQVEAMLIENGRREDLSPMEEAEGYQQLQLFGYKPKDIATAVGHSARTVTARLKLLKLSEPTREKVHTHDLTLEDALAITAFADDADTTQALEKAAGGSDFRWQLQQAQNRVKDRERTAKRIEELQAVGAKEYTLPEGVHNVWAVTGGPRPTWSLAGDFGDAEHHDGCLAYLVDRGGRDLLLLCTDPDKHQPEAKQLTPEQKAEEKAKLAELDAQRADRAAETERQRTAQSLRVASALEHVAGVRIPKPVADTFRALLPALITQPDAIELTEYYRAMDVPDDAQWTYLSGWEAKQLAHIEQMAAWSDYDVLRAMVATLLSCVELVTDLGDMIGNSDPVGDNVVLRYLAFLEAIGHDFSDVDREIQTAARGNLTEVPDEDESA